MEASFIAITALIVFIGLSIILFLWGNAYRREVRKLKTYIGVLHAGQFSPEQAKEIIARTASTIEAIRGRIGKYIEFDELEMRITERGVAVRDSQDPGIPGLPLSLSCDQTEEHPPATVRPGDIRTHIRADHSRLLATLRKAS